MRNDREFSSNPYEPTNRKTVGIVFTGETRAFFDTSWRAEHNATNAASIPATAPAHIKNDRVFPVKNRVKREGHGKRTGAYQKR